MKGAAFVGLAALAAGALALFSKSSNAAEPSPAPGGGGGAPSSGTSGARLLRLTSPQYMSGPDVLQWQTNLSKLGFSPGKLDGVFGPLTETKTREFQSGADLEVDGIVGPATRAAAARMLLAGGGGGAISPEPEPDPGDYETQEPDGGAGFEPEPAPVPIVSPGVVTTPPFVPPVGPFAPSTPVVPGPTVPPDALLAEVAAALATNDPIVIRAMIAKVATLGWPQLAADLQAALKAVEAGQPIPVSIFTSVKPPLYPGAPTPAATPAVKPPATPAVKPAAGPRVLLLTQPNLRGTDVLQVQQRLQAHGYSPGKLDSVYGPGTETAVRTFQKAKGLAVDGKVGPNTLAALNRAPAAKPAAAPAPVVKPAAAASSPRVLLLTSPNMHGNDVMQVQQRLNALGYNVGKADGFYGPKTETAVRTFQKAKGLAVDGKVGPNTRAALGGITAVAGDEFVPPYPLPASPLPGVIPMVAPVLQQSPFQTLATELVLHLVTHPERGSEDQNLVQRYQSQVRGLQPTGLYGPGTALSLIAMRTGHVPPKPRYWPKEGTAATKAKYSAQVLAQAAKDPQRAEEWRQAAEIP